jgi:uncharacterized protein YajQ (UPF0234 family)
MPSFDVVSEIDKHELSNAVDQANREISNRFDFKGSQAEITIKDQELVLTAENEFQVKQMIDILHIKIAKRGIDIQALKQGEIEEVGRKAILKIALQEGVDADLGRKIVKLMKQKKIKVQTAIQGDQVRISGKKRDDLQSCIQDIKQADFGVPLQFSNFRD